ncbi:hypothetical protein [Marinobacterium arenosum]|uniref:hypothetical protein n=1 Tax=Marinobacterium arenosum TaxID=2862496 RepID=UPI001C96BF1B|nr:hypothetical protein [Marinobacterium arenosum]MBY4675566.1 hypothetical protein [Marinobacterium arenosum]
MYVEDRSPGNIQNTGADSMLYITRDKEGVIQSISQSKDDRHREEIDPEHPEIISFLDNNNIPLNELGELKSSDSGFIRVLEDVIDILIDRDIIQFTDLPDAAQQKLLDRRELRQRLVSSLSTSSTLLGEEDSPESLI